MKNGQDKNPLARAGALQKVEASGTSFEMAWCPAGRFWMGSKDGVGRDNERPRHEVLMSKGFWLGRTPVTETLYALVMGEAPAYFKGTTRPVEGVSWYEALRFCNKLSALKGLEPVYEIGEGDPWGWRNPTVIRTEGADGFQLPTEAEWEYAAKAGTELTYAGSDDLDAVGWHSGNSGGETHPVGQKQANAWGLWDMSGNVSEWCWGSEAGGFRPASGGNYLSARTGCRATSLSQLSGRDPRHGRIGLRLVRHS